MQTEIKKLVEQIDEINKIIDHTRTLNIMEVCGTHTMSIARYGIQQLLPSNINLISGPGCPVCVTPIQDIDWFLEIINMEEIVTYSFGDLLKVPGTRSSLFIEKSKGKNIRLCYSPLEALEYAIKNKSEKVLFIAIGFETTAPLTSVLIRRAYDKQIKNFFIFSAHKIIPPALKALLNDKDVSLDGLLLPGHVASITGTRPFEFVAEKYKMPCVVTGFESWDVLKAILSIMVQLQSKTAGVEIEYSRVVKPEGNPFAMNQLAGTFDIKNSNWRGIGMIPGSGLDIMEKFGSLDAKKAFPVKTLVSKEPVGCLCGAILKGTKKPTDCRLFAKKCIPDNPVGPCMVSSEGTCAAYFKYKRFE